MLLDQKEMTISIQRTGTMTELELSGLQNHWKDNEETKWTPYTPEAWKELNKYNQK